MSDDPDHTRPDREPLRPDSPWLVVVAPFVVLAVLAVYLWWRMS